MFNLLIFEFFFVKFTDDQQIFLDESEPMVVDVAAEKHVSAAQQEAGSLARQNTSAVQQNTIDFPGNEIYSVK